MLKELVYFPNDRCGGGVQTRARACNLPTGCMGNDTDIQACNTQDCSMWLSFKLFPCQSTFGAPR